MLSVSGLSVSIGAVTVVRDASLAFNEGEMCGLIGRNGAGKTTFLRALMGALPATGKAELDAVDLLQLPAHGRAVRGIGYMPEDRRLVPEFSVEDNVRLPAWSVAIAGVEQRLAWIYAIMPEVARFSHRRALELSGGQQKMVALARALMAGTRLLLLDEPFEGLAPALARRLGEVLADLKTQRVSVLIAESNERHVADLLASAFRIERGSVTRQN
jgi:branched-chain amino acid transport system ATP-binding protein